MRQLFVPIGRLRSVIVDKNNQASFDNARQAAIAARAEVLEIARNNKEDVITQLKLVATGPRSQLRQHLKMAFWGGGFGDIYNVISLTLGYTKFNSDELGISELVELRIRPDFELCQLLFEIAKAADCYQMYGLISAVIDTDIFPTATMTATEPVLAQESQAIVANWLEFVRNNNINIKLLNKWYRAITTVERSLWEGLAFHAVELGNLPLVNTCLSNVVALPHAQAVNYLGAIISASMTAWVRYESFNYSGESAPEYPHHEEYALPMHRASMLMGLAQQVPTAIVPNQLPRIVAREWERNIATFVAAHLGIVAEDIAAAVSFASGATLLSTTNAALGLGRDVDGEPLVELPQDVVRYVLSCFFASDPRLDVAFKFAASGPAALMWRETYSMPEVDTSSVTAMTLAKLVGKERVLERLHVGMPEAAI